MRRLALFASILASCTQLDPPATGTTRRGLIGVPVNGYPSYDERLQLVAQNRARSDPNYVHPTDPSLDTWSTPGTAGCQSTMLATRPPLDYEYDIAQAARFHSRFLLLNDCPLDHYSFCTLRTDIEATACDGAAACACNGGECWPSPACDQNDNGCANSPGSRMSLFGYPGGTWGENGAAGYSDSWAGVRGWITECPPPADPTEGHRLNVISSSFNVIGTGTMQGPGGCWSAFYFSDYGHISGRPIPRIPSGVHRPRTGSTATTFSFYANYYDAGGDPMAIDLVIDGACHPMAIDIGTDVGNRTYVYASALSTGCHEYYVVARDAAGARVTYPEVGSLTLEVDGATCAAEYVDTQMPAACEIDGGIAPDAALPDAGANADGPAAADAPAGDSGSTPDSGANGDTVTSADGPPPADASPSSDGPPADGATAADMALPPDLPVAFDSRPHLEPDEGRPIGDAGDDADGGDDAEIDTGCNCTLGGTSHAGSAWFAFLAAAWTLARSRRSQHARSR
jgi:MYXO-CTERM domain-containing protein